MIDQLSRRLTAGVNLCTLSDYHFEIVTQSGSVQVYLQKVSQLLNYRKTQAGYFLELEGIRFIDISNMAATNNITFYAADGDTINGQSSYILNTNGISGLIFPTGDSAWMITDSATVTGVTSIALTAPNIFSVTGSPVTSSGTLAMALVSQSANLVFASPSGTSGIPTFRSLVAADLGFSFVSAVALSMPNIFSVSGSPITTSGTFTVALVSQNQNLVFASPNGSSGAPTFRKLVSADFANPVANELYSVYSSSSYTVTGTNAVLGNNYVVCLAGTYFFDLNYQYTPDTTNTGGDIVTAQIRTNTNTALTAVDGTDTVVKDRDTSLTYTAGVTISQIINTQRVTMNVDFILKSAFQVASNNAFVSKMLLRAFKLII